MRLVLVVLALGGLATLALGQVRTIPQDAKRARMSHLQGMIVDIDGTPKRLSPGAQIRDTENRLVLPAHLPGKSDVKYLVDDSGMVRRVWILTTQEKTQADKQTPPAAKSKPPAQKAPAAPLAK